MSFCTDKLIVCLKHQEKHSLVQCHFDYSCSSWYEGVCKSLRNKLQVMENKTVRFVKKLGLRTRINYPVFSDVGILNIENRVQQLRFNHVHTIFYDKGPKYMGQNFSKARDFHHHSTRGKHYNSVVPNVNGMTSTTFYFFKDWNSPVSNST